MFSAKRIFSITQPMNRTELLTLMANSLHEDGFVKGSFRQAVIDREAEYPTGIDMETHSIAIPHTEFEHVNKTGFAVAVNQAGVEFQRTDEPKTRVKPAIIVMMAIDPTCEKVAVIQSLFALLGDVALVNKISLISPKEIAQLFTDAIATR